MHGAHWFLVEADADSAWPMTWTPTAAIEVVCLDYVSLDNSAYQGLTMIEGATGTISLVARTRRQACGRQLALA